RSSARYTLVTHTNQKRQLPLEDVERRFRRSAAVFGNYRQRVKTPGLDVRIRGAAISLLVMPRSVGELADGIDVGSRQRPSGTCGPHDPGCAIPLHASRPRQACQSVGEAGLAVQRGRSQGRSSAACHKRRGTPVRVARWTDAPPLRALAVSSAPPVSHVAAVRLPSLRLVEARTFGGAVGRDVPIGAGLTSAEK